MAHADALTAHSRCSKINSSKTRGRNTGTCRYRKMSDNPNKDFLPIQPFENFSDRAYRVQNVFFGVSVISLFVSVFDLKDTSRVFGFDVANFNERYLEISFFITSVYLGVLYLTRIFEERDVVLKLDEKLSRLSNDVKKTLIELGEAHKDMELEIKEDTLSSQEIDDLKRLPAVKHFEKTTIDFSEQLELLQELCLPNFQKRKFLNRRKFRLFFFDIIAPVLMLIILVFATFFTTKFNYLINILVG